MLISNYLVDWFRLQYSGLKIKLVTYYFVCVGDADTQLLLGMFYSFFVFLFILLSTEIFASFSSHETSTIELKL